MFQESDGLSLLNQCSKEMDDIYHSYAARFGLSDTAFWSIYYVWEHSEKGQPCTQKEICESWSYSPQTVNSALKTLEARGFAKLVRLQEDKKSKQILLTDTGRALADQVITSLVNAEQSAFAQLDPKEQREFVRITQKYTAALKDKIHQI